MKEIPLLIKILSGKSVGMSFIVMDVPNDLRLNKAMAEIIKKDLVSVEVDKVECIKSEDIISFHCSIDEIKNSELILAYSVSKSDFSTVSNFFAKNNNPKKSKDNQNAIILIKNIIDSYDPLIQVASE